MDIEILEDTEYKYSVRIKKDSGIVNVLRRSILTEIETFSIDIVTFHENTSPRLDEVLALRLGQCVIDNTRYDKGQDFKTTIDVKGPANVTTDDIPGIPFKYRTPIVTLRGDQRLLAEVIVRKGTGRDHVKWRPVASLSLENGEGYTILNFKNIGMLSNKEIFDRGWANMKKAMDRPPSTIFSKIIV